MASGPRSHSGAAARGWAEAQVWAGAGHRDFRERGQGARGWGARTREPVFPKHGLPLSQVLRPFCLTLYVLWGPDPSGAPGAFFGAPCVFTHRQPASPNLTLPSARMLALRLPWGRLLAPGSELRCAPPWGTSFSRVGYLHISPGSILSGAMSTNVLISQSSCFS